MPAMTYAMSDLSPTPRSPPKAKNAINSAVYLRIVELLGIAAKNDSIVVVVITGGRGYFTSGADIKELEGEGGDMKAW